MIKSYSIRIDEELLDKLHYLAQREARSANRQVLQYIQNAVDVYETENGSIVVAPRKVQFTRDYTG